MTQRLRESLALALLALLPFHALLVTVATRLIAGPGHAPLGILALWKEGLLAVLLVFALVEIVRVGIRTIRFDVFDWLILALVALSVAVTILTHGDWKLYALGFKYDFLPLVAFLIFRRVPWSDAFIAAALRAILIVGGIVAAYGILTFFLPLGYFTALGYSPAHSLYEPSKALSAFHQIGESSIRRIQGPMSGPNQLGLWLLLPLSVMMAMVVRRKVNGKRLAASGYVALIAAALFLSFSRSAWIAAFVMGVVSIGMTVDWKRFLKLIVSLGTLALVAGIGASVAFPQVFFRLSSSRGHVERPVQAFRTMIANPLGLGLGSAGPASNRVNEPCVFLRPIDDPGWAKSTPDLCVFVGDKQVQPADHACRCPFLPENWYLQIGVELGILGFVLYLTLTFFIIKKLIHHSQFFILHSSSLLMFIGIAVAAIFLHAWEDAAVAVTVWLLVAATLRKLPQPPEDIAR